MTDRGSPPPPTTARKKGPTGTHLLTGSAVFRIAAPSRITTLRVRGTGQQLVLPATPSFTLGREPTTGDPAAPHADVRVPSRRKAVSLVHATFEWRGDRLWCRDERSTNGTFADDQPQHDWFCITSGMRLDVGDTKLLALDWRLAALQTPLAWCLGLDAVAAVDRALGLVPEDGPLLLTGPRGCDQEWLARRIHDASGRREHPFSAFTTKLPRGADALLTDARWGTVFVDLATVGKVSKAFAAKLFGGDTSPLRLRPIISATSHIASQRAFEDLAQTQMLQLPPLAQRREEVPRLFDALMAEHGSRHRIRDLGPPRIERLMEHDWPSNLDELREAERRIRALLEGGNKTQAAKLVGSSRQALDKFLRRIFHD
jgi:hypothetical protein